MVIRYFRLSKLDYRRRAVNMGYAWHQSGNVPRWHSDDKPLARL